MSRYSFINIPEYEAYALKVGYSHGVVSSPATQRIDLLRPRGRHGNSLGLMKLTHQFLFHFTMGPLQRALPYTCSVLHYSLVVCMITPDHRKVFNTHTRTHAAKEYAQN